MSKYIISIFFILLFGVFGKSQTFKTHRVTDGETIKEIASKYGITPLNIYELNPSIQNKISSGDLLLLPNEKAVTAEPQIEKKQVLESFKSHKTRRKETISSITRKYNITEDDLKRYNTFLYANILKRGDRLQIPIFKTVEIKTEPEFLKSYTVLPKEGKWRISYKFGITIEELNHLNPNISDTLQEGQVIKVPNLTSEKAINDTEYSYYTVLPKEGFFRLKQKLNLTQQELETLNPELIPGGLKSGMVLKIPFRKDLTTTNTTNKQSLVTPGRLEYVNLSKFNLNKTTKRIVVMLPFKLNSVQTDSIELKKDRIENDPYIRTALDYYAGLLTAVDTLKAMGISLRLDVYDTESSKAKVSSILNSNNFSFTDAVIGPLTTTSFNQVAIALQADNIPVIAPISNTVALKSNVFKSKAEDEVIKRGIINFLKQDPEPYSVLIVADSDKRLISNKLKQDFPYAKQLFSAIDKDGKDMRFIKPEALAKALSPGKNYVFLESENPGFVSNVVGLLNPLITKDENNQSGRDIILVTTNFNSAFESDEVSNHHLSHLQFQFASASKSINTKSRERFIQAFYDRFGERPNKIAIRGYDLTLDVVLRIAASGSMVNSINYTTEYVENKFKYEAKPFGGYVNNDIYILKYNDLDIVEVKQTSENTIKK